MGIDHQRVGAIAAVEYPAHLREYGRNAAVGRVDVQPNLLPLADIGDVRDRIDRRRRSSSNGGNHREWDVTSPQIALHSAAQRLYIQPQLGVGGNFSERIESKTKRHHRLVDARVRFLGAIHHDFRQVGASRQTFFPDAQLRMQLTRCREGIERIGRGSVGDHAEKTVWQPDHLTQPVERQ